MSATQPVKFVLVGVGGYFVNLAVFAGLLQIGVPYVLGSIISYFISNALMYLGNRYYTFSVAHDGFWRGYVRYILVGFVVAGLNAIVLAVLVETVGLHALYGQALSLLLITPVAFVMNKRWTFGDRPVRRNGPG